MARESTYTYKGCMFKISQRDGTYYVNYIGWMGKYFVGEASSWEEATGIARHYARTQA